MVVFYNNIIVLALTVLVLFFRVVLVPYAGIYFIPLAN